MSSDRSAVVRRWFQEVWNDRRVETIDELTGPESVCRVEDGTLSGPDEFRTRLYLPFLAAFPDLHVEIDDLIEHGDDVVVRWSAQGTHRGPDLGCPPTNHTACFRGISWIRVRDGKFVEGWQSSNIPDVIREMAEKAAAGNSLG